MPRKLTEPREKLRRMAEHARWLADRLEGDPAAERLRTYADELDAQTASTDGNDKKC